nr:10675_t:CDS:2 [Entrophospora candida]
MSRRIRSRLSSIGSAEDKNITKVSNINSPHLHVEFEVGRALQLRPDIIVRGAVILSIPKDCPQLLASAIKIFFKGEETASAKVKDSGVFKKRRLDSVRTTYFECSYVVWCASTNNNLNNNIINDNRANRHLPLMRIKPGIYRSEFALKLPPVNFPPSIEGPRGFSIRYIWKPVIEGADGNIIEGPEIVTPFTPISFAPPNQEWCFREVLYTEHKSQRKIIIEAEAFLQKRVFSPGEELDLKIRLKNHSGGRITCVQCSLRKHFEGPLHEDFMYEKHERLLVSVVNRCEILSSENKNSGELDFSLSIPKKIYHVPPTFTGRHLRTYYTLRCALQTETGVLLTKMEYHEIIIPITMSSYPHVDDIQLPFDNIFPSYTESGLCPFFFDPKDDFPQNYPIIDRHPGSDNIATPPYSPIPSAFPSVRLSTFYSDHEDSSTSQSPYFNENESSIINDYFVDKIGKN